MEKKVYVGNLAYGTTEQDLSDAFSAHGQVVSVHLVTDRETGRSRGFGFVEMASTDDAKAAITALNEASIGGRSIQVNEARPRNDDRGGGGRGGERKSGGGQRQRW